jgi:heme oxygenase
MEYIKRQEIHHQRKTFKEEYRQFLEKFEVDYDERFVFKEIGKD